MGAPQQSYHGNSACSIAFWEMYFILQWRFLKDFLQGRCVRSCAFIGYFDLRHHAMTNGCPDTVRRCEFWIWKCFSEGFDVRLRFDLTRNHGNAVKHIIHSYISVFSFLVVLWGQYFLPKSMCCLNMGNVNVSGQNAAE